MPDQAATANTEPAFGNLFRPRSVAVVGASPKRGTARNTLLRALMKHGFAGSIYPVTPSNAEVEGLPAYPSVDVLPTTPDLALIITPAETVADIVAACGRKGIRAAIVYSAGFEETSSGKEHARRLAEAAAANNVLVLGPNCMGLWSVRERTVLSFGGAAMSVDTLKHAPVAVISQSGALSSAISSFLQKSGIGCSYVVSVGNETCLDLIEVLDWIIRQDDVRVVGLYLEGLSNASRILDVASRAQERGIQIVALKAGRSAVGQIATASHTGKIASSHAVYADVLEQAGVISVDSLAEALSAMEVLGFMPNPRVSGDPKGGVAVLSSSGGAGALLADQSEAFGIPMCEFSPSTDEVFERLLPAFAHKSNPVDLTGQIHSIPNLFEDACSTLSADPRTEALVIQFASSGMRNIQENGDAFKAAAQKGGFPMVISFVAEMAEGEARNEFRDAGILLTDDTSTAMRALSWLYRRKAFQRRPKSPRRAEPLTLAAPQGWAETMAFCEECGITPAKWVAMGPQQPPATACAGLKFPLVVKVLPSETDHKTELGLVRLRIRSFEEVDAIAAEFRRKLGKADLQVLVQEMIEVGVEVVLSCLRNADFGPIVSIGTGGVAIELYRDVSHLSLPASHDQVVAALKNLKLWKLLQGFRGQPAADVDALARAAVSLGDRFVATPSLAEFEINPLLVRRKGEGVAAVDALVVSR
jgi:acetate---CoA ligase (ADP-forming)